MVFAEGNAELTPARLIGQYDPAQVLAGGYVPGSFTDGPLLRAMRAGALLYLEEFNRVPEETLNVLITVLTEGEIAVPEAGRGAGGDRVPAGGRDEPVRRDRHRPGQPGHLRPDLPGRAGLPGAAAEREITAALTGRSGPVVDLAVALTRATREHRTSGWARRCAARSTWCCC